MGLTTHSLVDVLAALREIETVEAMRITRLERLAKREIDRGADVICRFEGLELRLSRLRRAIALITELAEQVTSDPRPSAFRDGTPLEV